MGFKEADRQTDTNTISISRNTLSSNILTYSYCARCRFIYVAMPMEGNDIRTSKASITGGGGRIKKLSIPSSVAVTGVSYHDQFVVEPHCSTAPTMCAAVLCLVVALHSTSARVYTHVGWLRSKARQPPLLLAVALEFQSQLVYHQMRRFFQSRLPSQKARVGKN